MRESTPGDSRHRASAAVSTSVLSHSAAVCAARMPSRVARRVAFHGWNEKCRRSIAEGMTPRPSNRTNRASTSVTTTPDPSSNRAKRTGEPPGAERRPRQAMRRRSSGPAASATAAAAVLDPSSSRTDSPGGPPSKSATALQSPIEPSASSAAAASGRPGDVRDAATDRAAVEEGSDQQENADGDERNHQRDHSMAPCLPRAIEILGMHRGFDERLAAGRTHDDGVGPRLVAGAFIPHAQRYRAERRGEDPVGRRQARCRRRRRQHVFGGDGADARAIRRQDRRHVHEPQAERRGRDEEIRGARGPDIGRPTHPGAREPATVVDRHGELVRLDGSPGGAAIEDVEERALRIRTGRQRLGGCRISGDIGGHA